MQTGIKRFLQDRICSFLEHRLQLMCLLLIALFLGLGMPQPVQAGVIAATEWSGGNNTLYEDYLVTGTIRITGDVTINGNGHSFINRTSTNPDDSATIKYPVFVVGRNASLTLNNVCVNANGMQCDSSPCIVVNTGGKLYINSGSTIRGARIWYGNGQGGHGVYGAADSYIKMSGGTITDCTGFGIGSYGTVDFTGGVITGEQVGISVPEGTLNMTGGTLYGNSANGIMVSEGGSVNMSGGDIYSNPAGINESESTVTVSGSARIHDNSTGIVSQEGGTIQANGGSVFNNTDQNIYVDKWCQCYVNGTDIYGGSKGIVVAKGDVTMQGGAIHGTTTGITAGADATVSVSGGEIRQNGTGIHMNGGKTSISGGSIWGNSDNGITAYAGTLTATGSGSIYGQNYGIYSTGATVTISGCNFYNHASAAVSLNGSNAKATISGGSFWSNGYDVLHAGQDGDSGLVIHPGANGGSNNRMSVWLTAFNKYVTTPGTHQFNIISSVYSRRKILVRSNSSGNAQDIYNNMNVSDSGAFTKRVYGNDVMVWDRYTQTTKHRRYDHASGSWAWCYADVATVVWAEDKFTPQFNAAPANYRTYATTKTDPNSAAPTDGSVIRDYVVNGANTFYACYYPDKYYVHFDGNGATGGAMTDQTMQYGVNTQLNGNAFAREFNVSYDLNGGSGADRYSDHVASTFNGWKVSPQAIGVSFADRGWVKNLVGAGETKNLYAGWTDNAITLPNASKDDLYWEPSLGWCKYYFIGWYTAPAAIGEYTGTCVGLGGQSYTPKANVTLYAHWDYKVCVYYNGNYNDGGGMSMDDQIKGDIKKRFTDYIIRDNGYTKTGYDFGGWDTIQRDMTDPAQKAADGNPVYAPGSIYNQDIPLTLFSVWKTRYDIAYMGVCQTEGKDYLDNNRGSDYSQLTDQVKLNKSTDMKVDTTKSFVDAETGAQITEKVTGTGVGWAFGKDIEAKYKEAYIADDTEYSAQDFYRVAMNIPGAVTIGRVSTDYVGTVPPLNSNDMAVVNLYRVWDYGPLVEAYDLYYTLAQAQSGFVTEAELLSHAVATDEEDGTIKGGDNAKNSFRVVTYQAEAFTNFKHGGTITETYAATDSVGNVTKHQVTIHIANTEPTKVKPEGTTRFISEKYYNSPYAQGGLTDDSLWKTDNDYSSLIQNVFSNLKNDTPVETYKFSHDTILQMQQFVDSNGIGNSQSEDALSRFYEQFMAPNKQ